MAAGVAAATAAAVVTLIIARRHAKCRAKLAGLTTPDPEASKDYQDLCRVRMQAKQPGEKVESPRITSLSRESEYLPSNRSSTSSWGEEPALSNMDISTGHMVLVSIITQRAKRHFHEVYILRKIYIKIKCLKVFQYSFNI